MRFNFAPHETSRLRKAAERAKKLGDTAAKACQKAEVDDSAASELSGYAEEADLFLQKATKDGTDLGARHCMALGTGIRSILADLEKDREEQGGLFIDVDNLDDGMHNYRALLTKVRGGGGDPELSLDEETTIELRTPSGIATGPVPMSVMRNALDVVKSGRGQ